MSNLGTIIAVVCGLGVAVIAVAIAGFFIFRMLRGQAQARNLLQTGTPAPAVIMDIQDTGWRVNDQPQAKVTLQVTPTDRPPFQAVITQTFDVFDLSSLAPGAPAQVRFDPTNPSKIVIESLGAAAGAMVAPGMMVPNAMMPGSMGTPNMVNQQMVNQQLQQSLLVQDQYFAQLRITGTEAHAKVVSMVNMNIRNEDTGWVFHIMLDVTTPTGEHFQSQTQAAILDASQYKYQPGQEVIIRYDPNNKEQVALVRSLAA